MNASLTFGSDDDHFRWEARASDGRGFGGPGRSDACILVGVYCFCSLQKYSINVAVHIFSTINIHPTKRRVKIWHFSEFIYHI